MADSVLEPGQIELPLPTFISSSLIARPHFHGGEKHDVNKAECHRADLVEIRCVTWHDWVFVNLNGDADDFMTCVEPIVQKLEGYDLSTVRFSEALEFNIAANWKLPIENFIEPYHVFSCHPWLNDFVGMDERDPLGFDEKVLFCGYRFQQPDPARGGQLPWFPNLPLEKQDRGDWFVLFPNFAFEIFPDQIDVFIAWPQGPEKCRETIALYFVGEGASAEKYSDARVHVVKNWNDLNHEDIGIIERMQSGRSSDGFDGGVLSPTGIRCKNISRAWSGTRLQPTVTLKVDSHQDESRLAQYPLGLVPMC